MSMVSQRIIRLVASAGNQLGIPDAYAFMRSNLTKSQVAILLYHRVYPKESSHFQTLGPQSFERQIQYLSDNYKITSLDKLVLCIQSRQPLPRKAVVITFDDGYKDNYLYAFPILRKHHIPATIFLATGYIDSGRLFWWDKVAYIIGHTSINEIRIDLLGSYSIESEFGKALAQSAIVERLKQIPEKTKNSMIEKLVDICGVEIPRDLGKQVVLSWRDVQEMDKAGVAFGAHSVNHPILTRMPLADARDEIIRSKKDIEQHLGKRVTAFSYPNGDFNNDIARLVSKSGFICAVCGYPQKLISSKDCVYQLRRVVAGQDLNILNVLLCGLWGDFEAYTRGTLHGH